MLNQSLSPIGRQILHSFNRALLFFCSSEITVSFHTDERKQNRATLLHVCVCVMDTLLSHEATATLGHMIMTSWWM